MYIVSPLFTQPSFLPPSFLPLHTTPHHHNDLRPPFFLSYILIPKTVASSENKLMSSQVNVLLVDHVNEGAMKVTKARSIRAPVIGGDGGGDRMK
jgi:hypothetical protein